MSVVLIYFKNTYTCMSHTLTIYNGKFSRNDFFLLEMIRKYCNFSNFTHIICMWTVLIRYLLLASMWDWEMLDDATIFNWKKKFLDVELKNKPSVNHFTMKIFSSDTFLIDKNTFWILKIWVSNYIQCISRNPAVNPETTTCVRGINFFFSI